MDSLKALSEINIKISEAKNKLFKIQEEETEYLEVREKKAMGRIQQIIESSEEMLKKVSRNYSQVKEMGQVVSSIHENSDKLSDDFSKLLEEFEERNVEWERKIGQQQDEINSNLKALSIESTKIENEKKNLLRREKQIEEDNKLIESRRQQIKVALEVLKKKKNG